METIDEITFNRFRQANHESLRNVQRDYELLLQRCVEIVRPDVVSPVVSLPIKLYTLLQVGARRALELTEATIRELNAGSFVPLFLLSRATFETAVLMLDTAARAEETARRNAANDLLKLDAQVDNMLFSVSRRSSSLQRLASDNRIGKVIHRVSKSVGTDLHIMYANLSEYAHPNMPGMLGAYSRGFEGGSRDLRLGGSPVVMGAAHWASTALFGLEMALNLMHHALDTHAKVETELRRVSERVAFENGLWPSGVPYPPDGGDVA
ncbi:hypothetical protein HY634_04395 [Candidatus Uhrbacteria bacterium]|nr:hypothetical protein [Candidatus Uhrbacteria bacterium]